MSPKPSWSMKAGSSRRDFIRRTLFGGAIASFISRAASPSAKAASRPVDRRQLGRTGADVSILGLGLGAAFMEQSLGTAHALLESALAKGINYWDTARSYGPSEGMIAPVLERNRNRVFLASKSDARDYDGFKRDLEQSLRVLRTNYIDLYQVHDLRQHELANLSAIESGAVRAARAQSENRGDWNESHPIRSPGQTTCDRTSPLYAKSGWSSHRCRRSRSSQPSG